MDSLDIECPSHKVSPEVVPTHPGCEDVWETELSLPIGLPPEYWKRPPASDSTAEALAATFQRAVSAGLYDATVVFWSIHWAWKLTEFSPEQHSDFPAWHRKLPW